MKKFILIGGPPRSATNSVSLFLHLHKDVVSFGNGSGVHPMTEGMDFFDELFKIAPLGLQAPVLHDAEIINYVKRKNESLEHDIDTMKDKPILVLRWDYGEAIFPLMLGISAHHNVELKMVVSLRNVYDVFKSQHNNLNYLLSVPESTPFTVFKGRMEDSFIQLKHLKKTMEDRLLFVDVTISHATSEYLDILDFVGIDSNGLQDRWLIDLPVTNKGKSGSTEYKADVSQLEEMRLELLNMEEK